MNDDGGGGDRTGDQVPVGEGVSSGIEWDQNAEQSLLMKTVQV